MRRMEVGLVEGRIHWIVNYQSLVNPDRDRFRPIQHRWPARPRRICDSRIVLHIRFELILTEGPGRRRIHKCHIPPPSSILNFTSPHSSSAIRQINCKQFQLQTILIPQQTLNYPIKMSIFGLFILACTPDKHLERKAFKKTEARMKLQEEALEKSRHLYYRVGGFR